MKLVSDWRRAWRWFSVQSLAISTGLLATWATLPDDLKAAMPAEWVMAIAATITAAGLIGRLVAQPAKESEHDHSQ